MNLDGLSGSSAGRVRTNVGTPATLTVGLGNGTGDFAGLISNGSAVVSFAKSGTGTQTLSGNNTYTGATTLNAGVLSVANLGNGGVASNIWQSSNAAANLVFNGGTLRSTGAGEIGRAHV